MINTAIIGASGFIGSNLYSKYRNLTTNTIGTSFSHSRNGLLNFNLQNPDLSCLHLQDFDVGALVIAAGNPNVGYCEQNKIESRVLHVEGVLSIIRQSAAIGIQPIFLSSDYVFDGSTGAYDDDASTNPGTEYGRQKKEVEDEIPRLTDNYSILRLSKIYGTQKGDGTLLDNMACSFMTGQTVTAASDQIFSPTHIDDLVKSIIAIQDHGMRGTINVCAGSGVSRYDVAIAMARALGKPASQVRPVALHDLPGMSSRPLNTSMRCSRLNATVCPEFRPLANAIKAIADQWKYSL